MSRAAIHCPNGSVVYIGDKVTAMGYTGDRYEGTLISLSGSYYISTDKVSRDRTSSCYVMEDGSVMVSEVWSID